jgi:hypothetical protein
MTSLWALGLLMVDSNSLWIRYVSMVVEVEGVTADENTRLQNLSSDTQRSKPSCPVIWKMIEMSFKLLWTEQKDGFVSPRHKYKPGENDVRHLLCFNWLQD